MESEPDIEQLLTEAGISFAVVEQCPHPQCPGCHPAALSDAA